MNERENNKAKCPVCGRFCKQEAVDKYNGMLNERNRLAKELDGIAVELGQVRKSLVEAQELCATAQKRAEDYEALYLDTRGKLDQACSDVKKYQDRLDESGVKLVSMQTEINDLRSENEKIYSRGFWARVFNRRIQTT